MGQPFLAGVIEGFYGQPWSEKERGELLDWISRWGLNTFLYAPKDDLKHRAIWRERYTADEAATLRRLIDECQRYGVRFIYAVAPGLDIRYGSEADRAPLREKFEQLFALGARNFAIVFDDIPDHLSEADREQFGSFASAQCSVANELFAWVKHRCPGGRLLFCPTAYCSMMVEAQLGGKSYLPDVGRDLDSGIEVFWTGPEIISRQISVAHIQEISCLLRRKPVLWDNLHANDYDGRRFFCGPYAGRPPELRAEVNGILTNPNNEFPLNFVPIRTLAAYLESTAEWNPREAWLEAVAGWQARFETVSGSIALEDLVLFLDCFYLPHEEGPEGAALYERARSAVMSADPSSEAAFLEMGRRLRDTCGRMPGLRERGLWHAMSRRVWELREELDLLERFVISRRQGPAPFRSDYHRPGTYRGGLAAQLQRLLRMNPDGTFQPGEKAP